MCDVVRISRVLRKLSHCAQEFLKRHPLVGCHHGTKANRSTLTVAAAMTLPKSPECKADVGHHLLGSISPLMCVQHHSLW